MMHGAYHVYRLSRETDPIVCFYLFRLIDLCLCCCVFCPGAITTTTNKVTTSNTVTQSESAPASETIGTTATVASTTQALSVSNDHATVNTYVELLLSTNVIYLLSYYHY